MPISQLSRQMLIVGSAAAWSVAGCFYNPTGSVDATGVMTGASSTQPDVPTTNTPATDSLTADPSTATGASTTTGVSTTTGPSATTTELTLTTTDPSTQGTTGDLGYKFAEDSYETYSQIDRHGAVEAGTAGIRASQGLGFEPNANITIRDTYNASDPAEDAMSLWVPEFADSITFFHDILDDELLQLGLTPATANVSLLQSAPILFPDTIKYQPSSPTSYPNGRRLEDPVVDITLAVLLLELNANQPLDIFADLPLNPPENDVPFQDQFPFLAPPHVP